MTKNMTYTESKPGETAEMRQRPVKYIIYSQEQAFRHMTQSRAEKEQALYMIVDEVLFNVWDALCLSIDQGYREAYLPYLPHVFDLLNTTENGLELCDYLVFIEETRMGVSKGDTLARRRAWRVVNLLMTCRASIYSDDEPDPKISYPPDACWHKE